MFGKLLYYRNLGFFGRVAQLVEQRLFKPKTHLAPFPKNRIFPLKNKDFIRSSEGQPKTKRACLARTLARAW